MTCKIDGCRNPVLAKAMCGMHYQRVRNGSPMNAPARYFRTGPLEDRFWSFVEKGNPDDCWIWKGYGGKYGCITFGGVVNRAHRVSYEIANGPIPEGPGFHGNCVCHRCDNKWCVNPAHLFLGTQAENLADMRAKKRGFIPHPKGEAHHMAKLTDHSVRAIRAALAEGQTGRSIATRFGVSDVVVSRINCGKLWTHVV